MDKVKKIKIKKLDGSLSEYLPIGVDAKDVDMQNGDNLEEELHGYDRVFDSVVEMISNEKRLAAGMSVRTLGYYKVNDGGAAEYKITNIKNDIDYQEKIRDGLYATLIAGDIINVKQLGVKGNGIDDDFNILQKICDKYSNVYFPYGTYLTTKTINITEVSSFVVDGNIIYTGNNYALEINKGLYQKISINSIVSKTGGGLYINATKNSYSYSSIYIKFMETKKESININGTKNPVTLVKFDGIRWHSTESDNFYLHIDENSAPSSFITEINIFNITTWSSTGYSVKAKTIGTNSNEIQFNLTNCNFEACNGFYTDGYVTRINIANCRTEEMMYKSGWLNLNKHLPQINISGNGLIIPKNIITNTDYNSEYLTTNLTFLDEISTINYQGGILTKNEFIPYEKNYVWTELVYNGDNDRKSIVPNLRGNIYNCVTISGKGNTIYLDCEFTTLYIRKSINNPLNLYLHYNNKDQSIVLPEGYKNYILQPFINSFNIVDSK